MLTPLELAEKQKFRTQVQSGIGAYKMALEVCRLSTSCKDFREYKRKRTFILEGKLLQMVADCMEYDYPKLQKSMLKKLDDCYLKVSSGINSKYARTFQTSERGDKIPDTQEEGDIG